MLVCLSGTLLFGCYENEDSGPDMVDPWLRERTPSSLRLENQIGAAVITDDWRHDESGAIRVQLVTGGIADWSKVKVVDIGLQYNATASISAGGTLDMSSGTGSFVVTAETGETRTYTVSYDSFKEPLEGVYLLDPISGILDGSAPKVRWSFTAVRTAASAFARLWTSRGSGVTAICLPTKTTTSSASSWNGWTR